MKAFISGFLSRNLIYLVPVALFVFLGFISLQINFMQNDDYVYYASVQNILDGRLQIHPYSGPTLYAQALVGAAFAKIFGFSHLPVLTVLASCISLFFFLKILKEILSLKSFVAILAGLIFYLNPLNIYEVWGFMTSQYFLAFFMPAVYFLLSYFQNPRGYKVFGYLVLTVLAFFVRQVAMSLPLAVALYYLLNKKYRAFFGNLVFFGAIYLYFEKLFPQTPRMIEVPLQFHHFLDFNYTYAVIYGTILVLVSFTLPLVFSQIVGFYSGLIVGRKLKLLALALLCAAAVFIFGQKLFKPESVSWGEYPYFENVFERTGFYPRGIHGTKYQFIGNYDLYRFWDLWSKVLLAFFIPVLASKRRFFTNFYAVFLLVYVVMLVATETFYDRYILVAIPFFIILVFHTLKDSYSKQLGSITLKISALAFSVFLGFLAYQFSADFLAVNKFVWTASEELVQKGQVSPEDIHGSMAWKLVHRSLDGNYKYLFSYDDVSVNSEIKAYYNQVKVFKVVYPGNFFIKPRVYLYEKKTVE